MNENLFKKILNYYNMTIEDFHARESLLKSTKLIDPFTNKDYVKVINKIKDLIQNNKKIIIYGDYDVDGISATTILVYTFKKLNYDVDYVIPSRVLDGYSLTLDACKRILSEKKYDCIITVDNGISCNEAIDYCHENGIEVIVIDHHEKEENVPLHTPYLFHWKESNFTTYNISAGTHAMFVSYGLLNNFDEFCLALSGISTISDIMPLEGINLTLIQMALNIINNDKFCQFTALVDNFDGNLKSYDVSLSIISKLNAVTRVIENRSVSNSVKYLLYNKNDEVLQKLACKINAINAKKKELIHEAEKQIIDTDKEVICQKVEMPIGLNGILANKTLNKYKVSCIFSKDNKGNLIGSVRSQTNYSAYDIVNNLKDLTIHFGGHNNACGVTIKEENFEEFKTRFEKVTLTPKEDKYVPIDITDINKESYDTIEMFEPFNSYFEKPLLMVKYSLDKIILSNFNNHVFINHDKYKIVCFNMRNLFFDNINSYNYADIIGTIEINNYQNNKIYQLIVKKVTFE